MNRAIVSAILLFLPSCVDAASTGFEDLVQGSEFFLGESITSNGLIFDTVEIELGSNKILVRHINPVDPVNAAGGSGLSLGFGHLGLDFPLPPGTQHVSFLYGAYTSNAGTIIINGESANPEFGFMELDGTTLGGVSFSAVTTVTNNTGKVQLNGPINSLVVGGVEFALDDVSIIVPEPTSAALLLIAFLCGASRLRWRSV